jgi:hypothetical protein
MALLESVILQGTRGAQPAATAVAAGTLYGVTDEGDIIERSDGATWEAYSPSVVTGGITQLTSDVTAGPGSGSVAATIANDAVTFAKMANAAANTIVARAANSTGDLSAVAIGASQLAGRGSSGDIAAITLGNNLSIATTTLSVTSGYVLLGSQALSGATTEITTLGTTTHKMLMLVFDDIKMSNDDTEIQLQITVGGVLKTADFSWVTIANGASTTEQDGSSSASVISLIANAAGWGIGNATDESCFLTLNISNPHGTTNRKRFSWQGSYAAPDGTTVNISGGATWNGGNESIETITVLASAGTLASGTVYVYGLI